MKTAALVLSLLSTAALGAPACDVPPISGVSYHQARARLIEAGFLPVPYSRRRDASGFIDAPAGCDWFDHSALGYVETQGIQNSGCSFAWSRNGTRALIAYTLKHPTLPVASCSEPPAIR